MCYSGTADAIGMKFGGHAGHYHMNPPSKYEHCGMTGTGYIRVRRRSLNPALSTTSAIEASVAVKSIGDNLRTPRRIPIKFTLKMLDARYTNMLAKNEHDWRRHESIQMH